MVPADKWLLIILKHTQYCWENVTMMRYNVKHLSTNRLKDVFSGAELDEYNEGSSMLNRLLKDATVVAPGQKSVTFLTPFNSDWYWSNRTYNVKANEVWSETNVMSELKIPVRLDKMIECMLPEMNKDVMRYNSPNGSLAFEYQKSLRNGF